jgi:hypothetical protein
VHAAASYGWQASFGEDGEAAKAARHSPKGEDGLAPMKCVYLLQSINFPSQTYIGLTDDLQIAYDLDCESLGQRRLSRWAGRGIAHRPA